MLGAWDGIEEFVQVARSGSFTAGAKALGVSVTHMSRSVARLEAKLQVQLFHRTTRILRLTDSGSNFFASCQRIIEEREEAIAAINPLAEPQGNLRVTCSFALGERFVAPIMMTFAKDHSALNIDLQFNNHVIDIVGEGFDLAIRTGHLADSRLVITRIASRATLTVASTDYLERCGEPENVAALRDHDCLIGSAERWHFKSSEDFRPHSRWRCNSGSAVLEAALSGMGICQLPAFYVQEHVEAGRLRSILTDQQPEDEPIWAVYPQRRHLSPKISLAVECLRKNLQPMLDR